MINSFSVSAGILQTNDFIRSFVMGSSMNQELRVLSEFTISVPSSYSKGNSSLRYGPKISSQEYDGVVLSSSISISWSEVDIFVISRVLPRHFPLINFPKLMTYESTPMTVLISTGNTNCCCEVSSIDCLACFWWFLIRFFDSKSATSSSFSTILISSS